MRLLVQRVSWAEVRVADRLVGRIEKGLLVLVGFGTGDTPGLLLKAAHKLVNLRVFSDEEGRMNLSLREVGGGLLVVSQFTLYGELRKGFRPSFARAAPPEQARSLYEAFLEELRRQAPDIPVETGEFGAKMAVSLCNDGPVTLWLEFEEV
jgi:D-tyrosyl-tRNA(Tyr) deacylase